jgi:hypothetical protein
MAKFKFSSLVSIWAMSAAIAPTVLQGKCRIYLTLQILDHGTVRKVWTHCVHACMHRYMSVCIYFLFPFIYHSKVKKGMVKLKQIQNCKNFSLKLRCPNSFSKGQHK